MVVDSISMFNHDFPLFGGKNHCFSMFFPMLSNLVSLSLGSRDLCPPGANFPISQPLGPLRTGGACWVSPGLGLSRNGCYGMSLDLAFQNELTYGYGSIPIN